jgi:CheY-like chemotaxis protein
MTPSTDHPGPKILIVDDQKSNLRLLEHTLRRNGYVEITATLEPRAVAALHLQHRYDVILLDLQMPLMNGFEVMEQLRDLKEADRPLILVLSADPLQKAASLQAGANGFLSKPFLLADVLAEVQRLLETEPRSASQPRLDPAQEA